MKFLVTGTAGFIGYHLARRLIELGNEVIGLDNINDYYDQNIKYERLKQSGINVKEIEYGQLIPSTKYPCYRFLKLNLEDKLLMNKLFASENIKIVCNLAAQAGVRYSLSNPDVYVQSNIVGFLNILEACRNFKINHLIYASSSSVYGTNKSLPFGTSDNVDHPISLYAASKKSNELMAHTYSHLFKIPTTGLRFFTVYGPWGRPDMALFLFTKSIIENKPIEVFNNGEMIRDFTYIDDIIEGIIKVIYSSGNLSSNDIGKETESRLNQAPYKIYNIGSSAPVRIMDFIEEIEKKLNKKATKVYLPIQPGDVPITYADVSDIKKDFNYQPNTSVHDGVSMFIDWYYQYHNSLK